jgi:hypothetical protein
MGAYLIENADKLIANCLFIMELARGVEPPTG